jgi:hypothetical protein
VERSKAPHFGRQEPPAQKQRGSRRQRLCRSSARPRSRARAHRLRGRHRAGSRGRPCMRSRGPCVGRGRLTVQPTPLSSPSPGRDSKAPRREGGTNVRARGREHAAITRVFAGPTWAPRRVSRARRTSAAGAIASSARIMRLCWSFVDGAGQNFPNFPPQWAETGGKRLHWMEARLSGWNPCRPSLLSTNRYLPANSHALNGVRR